MRARLVEALKSGRIQHETLDEMVTGRDLLQSGQVSVEEVIEFLKPSRGLKLEEIPHSLLPDVRTFIFRSQVARGGLPVSWYVKCYCLPESGEELWFVSVYSNSERKEP